MFKTKIEKQIYVLATCESDLFKYVRNSTGLYCKCGFFKNKTLQLVNVAKISIVKEIK